MGGCACAFSFFLFVLRAGSGQIVRPTTEEMFFLPQRPYCTLGPLRDQITYPSSQQGEGVLHGEGGGRGGGRGGEVSTASEKAEQGSISTDDEELLSLLEKVRGQMFFTSHV